MKSKDIGLPEIQEFLKLSRTYIRQLEIIKQNQIPEAYDEIINKTVDLVSEKINMIKSS
jgi:hypothetical protein